VPVGRVRAAYVLMLAAVIAIGMKVVGILLVVSLLIIPAASARRLSSTPERMAVLAALFGVLSVIGGLFGSLHWDLAAGPAVVSAATVLFVIVTVLPLRLMRRYGRSRQRNG
jgi:zinc transport system permease protein